MASPHAKPARLSRAFANSARELMHPLEVALPSQTASAAVVAKMHMAVPVVDFRSAPWV